MKCPNCGAEATGNFCNYCGSELPKKQETMNINGNVTINNYYQYPNEPNESDYDEEYEEDEDFDFEEEKESGFSIASLVCFILAIFFACGGCSIRYNFLNFFHNIRFNSIFRRKRIMQVCEYSFLGEYHRCCFNGNSSCFNTII